jgi:hypothetical protein
VLPRHDNALLDSRMAMKEKRLMSTARRLLISFVQVSVADATRYVCFTDSAKKCFAVLEQSTRVLVTARGSVPEFDTSLSSQ